jgi:coenzyme F420 hydrogenase subunit beta
MTTSSLSGQHPLEQIVQDGLCMGCGFCKASMHMTDSEVKVQMEFDPEPDYFVPKVSNWIGNDKPGDFICPGAEIDMVKLAKQVHGKIPDDPILGTYHQLRVCYSTNEAVRAKAASGGVIPAVLSYLFATGRIDVAYCVQPGEGAYEAQGRIIRSPQELEKIHGSVYHPVNFGAQLCDLIDGEERFAFVGLPCQIAGLEMLKAKNPELAKRHLLSIGLFCGGINTFKGIAYYLEGFKIFWSDVNKIAYREGPWPGKIKVNLKSTSQDLLIPRIRGNSRWKILRYVIGFQGYWMLKRCRLCPDQISDFADIAVGDPHLPKYRAQGGAGFSATVSRTERGENILREMIEAGKLGAELVDRDTIVASQGYTLDNRRHVPAYVKINQLLGGKSPELTVYPEIYKTIGIRHYIYGAVDLIKIALPKNKIIRMFYIPWQIFEYLFITFTPSLIVKRLSKLLRNQ